LTKWPTPHYLQVAHLEEKTFEFGILHPDIRIDEKKPWHQIDNMKSQKAIEIQSVVATVKHQFQSATPPLAHLDWSYGGGRPYLQINSSDVYRVYDIINAFLKLGQRVMILDGSDTTFYPHHTASRETQEKLMLELIGRIETVDYVPLRQLDIHDPATWITPEGKAYAKSKSGITQDEKAKHGIIMEEA